MQGIKRMFPRKSWCAQQIHCDKLILDGLPLQKAEVLVLLAKAREQPAAKLQEGQVCSQESVSASDVHLACERQQISLCTELHKLRDLIESYGSRLEALESKLTVGDAIEEETEEPVTLPALWEPPADDEDEDKEDKPVILVEKRGKRYYRTDNDEAVLRKHVMADEDGVLFLKSE